MPPTREQSERLTQLREEQAARLAARAAEALNLVAGAKAAKPLAPRSRALSLIALLLAQAYAVATVLLEGEHVSQMLVLYAAEFVALDACALPCLPATLWRRLGGLARDVGIAAFLLFCVLGFASSAIDPRPGNVHGPQMLDLLLASNAYDVAIYVGITLLGAMAVAWHGADRVTMFCQEIASRAAPRLIALLIAAFVIGLAAGVGAELFRAGLPWLSPHAFEVALAAVIAVVRVSVEHAIEHDPPVLRS